MVDDKQTTKSSSSQQEPAKPTAGDEQKPTGEQLKDGKKVKPVVDDEDLVSGYWLPLVLQLECVWFNLDFLFDIL